MDIGVFIICTIGAIAVLIFALLGAVAKMRYYGQWHSERDEEKAKEGGKIESKTQGRIEDGEVIVAQSFGVGDMGDPGMSNIEMADAIWEICIVKKIPVIAQIEVDNAIHILGKCTEILVVGVIKKHRVKGRYLDTYEVLSQAKEIMKKKRWNKAILVGHPAHIWRVKRILEKMGVEIIIPPGLESIKFDPSSTQWWTRGRLRWWLREIPTRLIYRAKGWT